MPSKAENAGGLTPVKADRPAVGGSVVLRMRRTPCGCDVVAANFIRRTLEAVPIPSAWGFASEITADRVKKF